LLALGYIFARRRSELAGLDLGAQKLSAAGRDDGDIGVH